MSDQPLLRIRFPGRRYWRRPLWLVVRHFAEDGFLALRQRFVVQPGHTPTSHKADGFPSVDHGPNRDHRLNWSLAPHDFEQARGL